MKSVINVRIDRISVRLECPGDRTFQFVQKIEKMPDPVNNDNIYPVGTMIFAREQPSLKLVIEQYMQRIYYCRVLSQPGAKQIPYFEKELIPPSLTVKTVN